MDTLARLIGQGEPVKEEPEAISVIRRMSCAQGPDGDLLQGCKVKK